MRGSLVLLLAVPLLVGCGGVQTQDAREDSFQQLVEQVNAQHPPLYDGTNAVNPTPGR